MWPHGWQGLDVQRSMIGSTVGSTPLRQMSAHNGCSGGLQAFKKNQLKSHLLLLICFFVFYLILTILDFVHLENNVINVNINISTSSHQNIAVYGFALYTKSPKLQSYVNMKNPSWWTCGCNSGTFQSWAGRRVSTIFAVRKEKLVPCPSSSSSEVTVLCSLSPSWIVNKDLQTERMNKFDAHTIETNTFETEEECKYNYSQNAWNSIVIIYMFQIAYRNTNCLYLGPFFSAPRRSSFSSSTRMARVVGHCRPSSTRSDAPCEAGATLQRCFGKLPRCFTLSYFITC